MPDHYKKTANQSARAIVGILIKRYNEGLRDWENVIAITRFCYIEVLFQIFCYYWGKENRSLHRGLRYAEICSIEVPRY